MALSNITTNHVHSTANYTALHQGERWHIAIAIDDPTPTTDWELLWNTKASLWCLTDARQLVFFSFKEDSPQALFVMVYVHVNYLC